MTQARLARYRDLARVAEAAGFKSARHADGRIVVIPDHGSRPIGRGLLNKILRQMELNVEEYHRLLDA